MENNKKKLAISIGCFDLLHEGHTNLFKLMKEEAEKVFVFLHSDRSIYDNKKRFPVQDYEQRQNNLLSCSLVDEVIYVADADPTFSVKQGLEIQMRKLNLKPEDIVYIRADDWPDFPGRKLIEELKIEIKLINYTKGVSSSDIRRKLPKDEEPLSA